MPNKSFIRNAPWRTFIVAGFITVVAVFCAGWLWLLLYQFTTSSYSYATNASLSLAQSIATLVETHDEGDLNVKLASAVKGYDYHVTLFDENFVVIADSTGTGIGDTRDPSSFLELKEIAEDGIGVDRRYSRDSGIEQIYVTKTCKYRGKPAYIHLATDARTLNDTLVTNQAIGLGLLLSCLLVASIICYITYRFGANAVRMTELTQAKFVANASHELKTPIAGIKLLSETILRAIDLDKPERIRECAKKIDEDSDHLEGIVNSLVEIARSQSEPDGNRNNRPKTFHYVDAREAAKSSFESHRILANRKKLAYTLEISIPDETNCMIRVPAPSSTAIADNLIENAINYTSVGFVHVALDVRDGHVVFTVTDSGMGMTQREQEMVFERYYRAQRSQTTNPNGSGIGLALVSEAVAASGGTIDLVSEPNKGSSFTVRIPLSDRQND